MGGGGVEDRARLIVAVACRRRLGHERDGGHPSVSILGLREHDGRLLGIGGGRFESSQAKHQLASGQKTIRDLRDSPLKRINRRRAAQQRQGFEASWSASISA